MSMRRTSSTFIQQGNMLHLNYHFSVVCEKESTYSYRTILTSVGISSLSGLSYKEFKLLV